MNRNHEFRHCPVCQKIYVGDRMGQTEWNRLEGIYKLRKNIGVRRQDLIRKLISQCYDASNKELNLGKAGEAR